MTSIRTSIPIFATNLPQSVPRLSMSPSTMKIQSSLSVTSAVVSFHSNYLTPYSRDPCNQTQRTKPTKVKPSRTWKSRKWRNSSTHKTRKSTETRETSTTEGKVSNCKNTRRQNSYYPTELLERLVNLSHTILQFKTLHPLT